MDNQDDRNINSKHLNIWFRKASSNLQLVESTDGSRTRDFLINVKTWNKDRLHKHTSIVKEDHVSDVRHWSKCKYVINFAYCVCVCHCILSNCVCAWMQKRKCVLGETLTVPEPRGNLKVNQLWETVMRAGWQSWNVRLVFIIKVIYCRLAEMLLHASFNSMRKCLEIGKISSNLNHTTIWCWMVNPIWIANDCSSINDQLRLAAEVSQFQ